MAKRKFGGVGRGLDALLPGASAALSAHQPARTADIDPPQIPLSSIIPNPRQPRRAFPTDDPRLQELSASIKEHGLLQPIVVKRLEPIDDAKTSQKVTSAWFGEAEQLQVNEQPAEYVVQYQIIAGERRWRASQMAGLTEVPVVIKDVTPQQMLELALIENIQRADLNPIEEALAYQALKQEFGLTQEMIAQQVGKDRSTIANTMRLLELAPKVREALITMPDVFTEGHARHLLSITNADAQVQAMQQIVAQHLNVRQTEELAKRHKTEEYSEATAQTLTAPPRRSV